MRNCVILHHAGAVSLTFVSLFMLIIYLYLWSLVINTKVSKALSQIRTVLLVNYHSYHNMKIKEKEGKVASDGGNVK